MHRHVYTLVQSSVTLVLTTSVAYCRLILAGELYVLSSYGV